MLDCMFMRNTDGGGQHPITLPEYASHFLSKLERLFGPRDPAFTLVGIDIARNPVSPHPQFLGGPEWKHIVVRLSPETAANPTLARWQLAHECLHLLDPVKVEQEGPATRLEEGLATWFQNVSVPEVEFREGQRAEAEALLKPWMHFVPDAIKQIRSEGVRIIQMSPQMLRDHCPQVKEADADWLCQPFSG